MDNTSNTNESTAGTFNTVHANILPRFPLSSYYKDKLGLHFEGALEEDKRVDIPGTGTLGKSCASALLASLNFVCS